MLVEHLLCAGACVRSWKCSGVSDTACSQRAEGLMRHRQGRGQGSRGCQGNSNKGPFLMLAVHEHKVLLAEQGNWQVTELLPCPPATGGDANTGQ